MSGWRRPIGVVLAGGVGQRMGVPKATVALGGRPLISYPLQALRRALDQVAIVAKPDSELPALMDVPVWLEPQHPRHPLVGILHALRCARGRAVLVCPADMPFVTSELVLALSDTDPGGALAVLAGAGEEIQPLLGCYQPRALELLARAAAAKLRVLDAVSALEPVRHEVGDGTVLFNVNTAEDLREAEGILRRRSSSRR